AAEIDTLSLHDALPIYLENTDAIKDDYVIFITTNGIIKKTSLTFYARPRNSGIIALGIQDDDNLLQVVHTHGNSEIFVATSEGRSEEHTSELQSRENLV